jgi:hypothetical protein
MLSPEMEHPIQWAARCHVVGTNKPKRAASRRQSPAASPARKPSGIGDEAVVTGSTATWQPKPEHVREIEEIVSHVRLLARWHESPEMMARLLDWEAVDW